MRRHAPAAERNREPILQALRDVLPSSGLVLEVASGTGQHIVHFAAALPALTFQPSDPSEDARASIAAWIEHAGVANVRPPVSLDVTASAWPLDDHVDAIMSFNMIHISPWATSVGLFDGAAARLSPAAPLVLYGPMIIDGHSAPSNVAFSQSLQARDPSWGVRELRELEQLATARGLVLESTVEMPANNHVVVFRRPEAS